MTQQTKVPVVAVVLAAGSGVRFDPAKPKQLVALNGKPIVAWSIEAFENDEHVDDIVVVVNNTVREAVEQLIDDASYAKVRAIITGGAERSDSTEAALTTLADAGIPQDAKILIHDAVRPFVSRQEIDGCIDALDEFTAATVACPSTDTILLTQDLGDREVIQSVPERRHSFRAQTPQAFRFGMPLSGIRRKHKRSQPNRPSLTQPPLGQRGRAVLKGRADRNLFARPDRLAVFRTPEHLLSVLARHNRFPRLKRLHLDVRKPKQPLEGRALPLQHSVPIIQAGARFADNRAALSGKGLQRIHLGSRKRHWRG